MPMRFAIVVIASLLSTNPLLADEPGPSKDIPELAPLDNWAGVWTGQIEKPTKQSDSSLGKWIVDGRYLQQSWKVLADADNPEISGTWIMTYDVKKKVYRRWQFNSDGSTSEDTGNWNAEKRTMTWTNRNAESGVTVINNAHFPEAGVEHWDIIATDRNGKTIFEMSGQVNRRKE